MDAETFRETLETNKQTELDRLGSNKLLIALTDATLETGAVLRAAADSEHAAHGTFRRWTETESDEEARSAFAWTRDRESDHRERVLSALADVVGDDSTAGAGDDTVGGDDADVGGAGDGVESDDNTTRRVYEPADGGTLHEYLRGRDDTVERVAAGLVGRPLVSIRTHTQIVSFFLTEQDTTRADLFRELKTETGEELDRGLALVDDLCADEDEWERAQMVAAYVIEIAYDDYADALRGLGIDVTPVC